MSGDLADVPRGRGHVHLAIDGALATLTIDNTAAANAISPGMMVDLVGCVQQIESSPVAAVLVHGAGDKAFCAGGDLRAVQEHLMDAERAATMCAVMGETLDRLWQLPVVVVAAVEGAALGGGAELLSAADVVFAAQNAQVGFIHARLGVSPGWGGGRRLVRRVGAQRALQIMATGDQLSAPEAARLGLIDHLVPPGTAREAATAWCAEVCARPISAVRGAARVVKAWRDTPEAGIDTERVVFAELWGGPDHLEALAKVFRR
jgi:enoyl-CoA hydratase/carnithine racemase